MIKLELFREMIGIIWGALNIRKYFCHFFKKGCLKSGSLLLNVERDCISVISSDSSCTDGNANNYTFKSFVHDQL